MKYVCLVSTGIDSPVAAYIISRYGEVVLTHASNHPFVDRDTVPIFEKIARKLDEVTGKVSRLYILPHGIALSKIRDKTERKFTCVLCKRMMLRYGKAIAEREGGGAIVTGDSLGQVASQTLNNLFVEQYNLNFPVIRPLIGMDKNEIVSIAREIGTYSISAEGNVVCKAVPRKPSTRADLEKVLEEEKKIDADNLLEKVLKTARIKDL